MSDAMILALVAVAVSLVAVLLAVRSGPRVTHIETRRPTDTDNDPSDDQPKAN